jgi:hypothetical protein
LVVPHFLRRSTPVQLREVNGIIAYNQTSISLCLIRGSTPMHADAAWATPGFSGAALNKRHLRAGHEAALAPRELLKLAKGFKVKLRRLRRSTPVLLQVCFKGSAVILTSIIPHFHRGSTPVHADAARASPGFSGAPPSGPRSHLANTTPGCAFASLGGAVVRFAASAKRHAFGRVHCPAAFAPLAQLRVRGAFGQKNPPRPRRSIG